MDKETTRVVAMFIVAEIKKSYFNARKKKTNTTSPIKGVLKKVKIVDAGEAYEVHIPYEIYGYHYGIKNAKLVEASSTIEQVITNGVKTYLNSLGKEGTVMTFG